MTFYPFYNPERTDYGAQRYHSVMTDEEKATINDLPFDEALLLHRDIMRRIMIAYPGYREKWSSPLM